MTSLIDVRWDPEDPILRPRQAARLLGVAPRTVSQWARLGLLEAHRTAGGHHRFRLSNVRRFARTLPTGARAATPWWA
jgi:excisionase family DNA binding protein